jgi:hypothetical protein
MMYCPAEILSLTLEIAIIYPLPVYVCNILYQCLDRESEKQDLHALIKSNMG